MLWHKATQSRAHGPEYCLQLNNIDSCCCSGADCTVNVTNALLISRPNSRTNEILKNKQHPRTIRNKIRHTCIFNARLCIWDYDMWVYQGRAVYVYSATIIIIFIQLYVRTLKKIDTISQSTYQYHWV